MSRQDFTEELYFRGELFGKLQGNELYRGAYLGLYSRKLTLDTTTGYFELPNYMNVRAPGLLIEEDLFDNSIVAQLLESGN